MSDLCGPMTIQQTINSPLMNSHQEGKKHKNVTHNQSSKQNWILLSDTGYWWTVQGPKTENWKQKQIKKLEPKAN